MSKIFNFFSGTNKKNDRGVSKDQSTKSRGNGISGFFYTFKNRFSTISSASLIFSLCNIPLIAMLFLSLSGIFDTAVPAPSSPMYATVYGLMQSGEKGLLISMLNGLFGNSANALVTSSTSKIFLYCSIGLTLTFGVASIGIAYNSRGIVRGEPLSSFYDYFSAIKKNFKQGILISLLDGFMLAFLAYDLMAYYTSAASSGSMATLMLFYVVLFFALIYYMMRFYVYLILVTFDLKTKKIIKNALYLVFLGWKRSLACIFGSILVVVLNLYIYWIMPYFGLLLPFALTFGLLYYIGVFCAYPIIDQYMIKPYYDEHPEELEQEEEVEPIFTDHG